MSRRNWAWFFAPKGLWQLYRVQDGSGSESGVVTPARYDSTV
jgi:hypothetical protein